jgi:hypothetical protein
MRCLADSLNHRKNDIRHHQNRWRSPTRSRSGALAQSPSAAQTFCGSCCVGSPGMRPPIHACRQARRCCLAPVLYRHCLFALARTLCDREVNPFRIGRGCPLPAPLFRSAALTDSSGNPGPKQ